MSQAVEPAGLLTRLGAIADVPGDGDEVRLMKRFLLLTGAVMSGGGLLWGTLAASNGLLAQSTIPYGYAVLTVINFAILHRTRAFAPARSFQITISLLLPFLFQWVLGGFVTSGCVMIWAMLSLVASLSFEEVSSTARWLVLYLGLVIVSAIIDGDLTVPAALAGSDTLPLVFFALNLCVVSSAVFGLTVFFVAARRQALEQLADKNREIAESQQALIQAEKMAALGQLVTGVAHELNTPLGAIRASAGNVGTAIQEILRDLPATLADATAEERASLVALLAAAEGSPTRTSREERQLRRRLHEQLEAQGVSDAADVADLLVDIGADLDLGDYAAIWPSPRRQGLLQGGYNLASLRRNQDNIRVAAERASKIVFALKSYAHPGAHGEATEASVADNVDTVLTLYQNQIKQGVDLVREFEEDGVIPGRHDELNQVWTNLIHNALQATGHKGRLVVRVEGDPAEVRVKVIDDGPGIPADLQPRVFEPFFTTKGQGEGTGLGLSISRGIVERHSGQIEVQSRPGHTEFTVHLPRGPGAVRAEAR